MFNFFNEELGSSYMPPKGVSSSEVDASFFTSTVFRKVLVGAPADGSPFKVTKASELEFLGLTGQSVSNAVLQFAPGGINTPHIHPRSAELLFVLEGKLKVGVVDSSNKLFTKILKAGDLFLFPKGLVHFQFNKSSKNPAVAISAFGSSNSGVISLTSTLFASGIDENLLAKSFKTDAKTIQDLVMANMGK